MSGQLAGDLRKFVEFGDFDALSRLTGNMHGTDYLPEHSADIGYWSMAGGNIYVPGAGWVGMPDTHIPYPKTAMGAGTLVAGLGYGLWEGLLGIPSAIERSLEGWEDALVPSGSSEDSHRSPPWQNCITDPRKYSRSRDNHNFGEKLRSYSPNFMPVPDSHRQQLVDWLFN
jgi:hypothetical protein